MEASKEVKVPEQLVDDDVRSTDSDSTLQSEHYHPNTQSLSNAPGLLIRTLDALNGKLKQWGNMASRNLSTILSAFELLSALADYICHMNMPRSSMLERSRDVVRHLCLYIQNSIKRPKWEHKRNFILESSPHFDVYQSGSIFMTNYSMILISYIMLWKSSSLVSLEAKVDKQAVSM